ncbi:hypothetical protein BDR06DRAFT_834391, partial [Suillus hirtellus]
KTAARSIIKARQVLIDIPKDSHLAPGKVSHAQLVTKIADTIRTITDSDHESLNLEPHAVSQFRTGAMVIEMQSSEVAEYLKSKDIKEKFINALDPNALLKERTYQVVIQFVPLTFDPDNAEQLCQLEKENDWEKDTITSARWIKPPTKRTPNQRVAHLTIRVNDSKIANVSIRDGIMLNKNRLQVKKNKREPFRCAKCQHYGHFAKECISHKDACATCAGEHRTSECDNRDQTCCIPCASDDHTSWDRKCPEFKRQCQDLDIKDSDNMIPYFPTEESWTQVQAPP